MRKLGGFGTGSKFRPLNAECRGTPVREFRDAVIRPFIDASLTANVNLLIASGYTGQTKESFRQDTHRDWRVRWPCDFVLFTIF
jgi:hypothetical protein